MNAYLLPPGRMLVPRRAEDEDGQMVGDTLYPVPLDHPDAQEWLAYYAERGLEVPRLEPEAGVVQEVPTD